MTYVGIAIDKGNTTTLEIRHPNSWKLILQKTKVEISEFHVKTNLSPGNPPNFLEEYELKFLFIFDDINLVEKLDTKSFCFIFRIKHEYKEDVVLADNAIITAVNWWGETDDSDAEIISEYTIKFFNPDPDIRVRWSKSYDSFFMRWIEN